MKLLELTPMLWTSDLKGTIDFYVNELAFTCHEHSDEWGWASLGRDGIGIMFSVPNAHIPFDGSKCTGSFYFRVDNADELWEAWKDKLHIAYSIETFDYGMRDFAIYDNNGYMLQFGHELATNA